MNKSAYIVIVIILVLSAGLVTRQSSLFLPSIPLVHASTVSVVLTGCSAVGGACLFSGWNGTTTNPNPQITVSQGDTLSVSLSSADSLHHRFIFDADVDDQTTADCTSSDTDPCSSIIPPSTTLTFTVNVAPGTYTYFCTFHPYIMVGSVVVNPTQSVGGVALPTKNIGLLAPYSSLILGVFGALAATIVYLTRNRRTVKSPNP